MINIVNEVTEKQKIEAKEFLERVIEIMRESKKLENYSNEYSLCGVNLYHIYKLGKICEILGLEYWTKVTPEPNEYCTPIMVEYKGLRIYGYK